MALRCSLTIAVALAAGCLPEAGAPAGTRVAGVRGASGLTFSREPGGQAAHLLYTLAAGAADPDAGALSDSPPRDLWAVPRAGGEPRLLLREISDATLLWDQRGRALAQHALRPGEPPASGQQRFSSAELTRLDLAAGTATPMGRVRVARLSPGRTRVYHEAPDGRAFLRTLDDDREHALGTGLREVRFVGEDLHYLVGPRLLRLGDGDEGPRVLLEGVRSWRPLPGGTSLLVVRPGEAIGTSVLALWRPASAVKPLPSETRPLEAHAQPDLLAKGPLIGHPFVSADGARLAWMERSPADSQQVVLRFLDLKGRRERAVTLALPPRPRRDGDTSDETLVEIAFRPGADEVWCIVNQQLVILRADSGEVLRPPGVAYTWLRMAGANDGPPATLEAEDRGSRVPGGSLFTGDGRWWLFMGPDEGVRIGDARDPGGPRSLLLGHWRRISRQPRELRPGRLAVFLEPGGGERRDLHIVDLERLESRLVARDLTRVTFGARRLLAITRPIGGDGFAPGALVLVDHETAEEIPLAHNVTEFVLPPLGAGSDPTEPGVLVGFAVHARLPFRYDGLWTAVLP